MKKIIILLTLFASTNVLAAEFSAFVNNNTLFVTILGDSCNSLDGALQVAPICDKNRMTENFVIDCEASLSVRSTKRFCTDMARVPRVLEIPLSETNVATEAKTLSLTYFNETVSVKID